jgi:glycosyltransferase involved in cell wall biosynthesis
MKTVVIDARESGTTTGRYIDKLIENLHALKPEHRFILLAKPHRIDYLKGIAPSFDVQPTSYNAFSFGEQLGFKRQIKKLKPDLVHFPMVQQPIWYRGRVVTSMLDLTTLRFKNPTKNPLVFGIKQFVYGYVNRVAAKKSKHIICISEYVKNDVVDYTGVSPDKITVTHNAADPITEPATPVKSLEGKEFIMYVGRPLPHKNLTRLIEAFELLKIDHPNLYLVLAGKKDSLYDAHERMVNERKITNVIFTGFISEGELRWLYEHTACYVFPSLSEGFGLPGLEAMAHNAPVASSNATCLPEIYETAAAYFNPLDIKHIAVVIDDIITNVPYANKLRTRGKKRYICFSWKKMAKQTLEVYDNALSE